MDKVGGVEQMLDDLKEWKNGTLSKSVGRRVPTLEDMWLH
jgi:hypothetical protein